MDDETPTLLDIALFHITLNHFILLPAGYNQLLIHIPGMKTPSSDDLFDLLSATEEIVSITRFLYNHTTLVILHCMCQCYIHAQVDILILLP